MFAPRPVRVSYPFVIVPRLYTTALTKSPSHMSLTAMLTGRLPIRSGIAGAAWTGGVFNENAVGGLPLNETTLAEMLKAQGYRTGAVHACMYAVYACLHAPGAGMAGKYHLGQRPEFLPTSRGFETYFVHLAVNAQGMSMTCFTRVGHPV